MGNGKLEMEKGTFQIEEKLNLLQQLKSKLFFYWKVNNFERKRKKEKKIYQIFIQNW